MRNTLKHLTLLTRMKDDGLLPALTGSFSEDAIAQACGQVETLQLQERLHIRKTKRIQEELVRVPNFAALYGALCRQEIGDEEIASVLESADGYGERLTAYPQEQVLAVMELELLPSLRFEYLKYYFPFVMYEEEEQVILDMKILQTTDLKKYYGTEPNITRALDGVNFSVEEGEFVAVVGTSGSGKSTLLHMMGGLDTPTSGSVMVRDKELAKMNDEQLTIFRRRNIGFIFQNYNLVPILNVYENIVLPVELDGDTVDQKFMADVVSMLGLEDKLKNMPNNLSGGQQQRVAIARALVSKPAIVLADEPTGNLDSRTSADVLGLLQRTSREFNQTLVMITHNDAIAQLADRIVRIEDGKIVG